MCIGQQVQAEKGKQFQELQKEQQGVKYSN